MLTTRTISNIGDPLCAPNGTPRAGVKISFILVDAAGQAVDAWDAATGERVAGLVEVVTDVNGEFSVGLWPNDRGNIVTQYRCHVDAPEVMDFKGSVPSGGSTWTWALFMAQGATLAAQQIAGIELVANKNVSGGYAGLTAFKLNLKNALNTITSFFTTVATAVRTWTMPDKDGVVAVSADLPGTQAPLVMNLAVSLGDQERFPVYTSNAVGEETFVRVWTAKSPLNYCKHWSKGGMRMNRSGGKSGDTLTGALARITDITGQAERPQYCFIWLAGNDWNNFLTSESVVAAVYAQAQADTQAIIAALQNAGIVPIMLDMPDNAVWQTAAYRLRTHYRYRQWLIEYCRASKIKFITTNNVLSRTKTQVYASATLNRTGTAASVNHTAHNFTTGDYIVTLFSANPAGDQLFFKSITVVDPNNYTFTHTNSGTLVNVSTQVLRSMLIPSLTSDGTTHLSERGARRMAKAMWPALQPLFPPVDILANSNTDYYNLVGCGIAAAIPQISLSDFSGTGGVIDGTAATVTGTMPDNWSLTVISGSPTITLSLVAGTDTPHENKNWLRMAIVAGGSDAELQIHLNHPKPAAWTANTVVTANVTIRKPTTETGLFAVCVGSGTTHASVEPTWPTEVGKQVIDGNATWEMRAGWKNNEVHWAAMEYWISAIANTDAIEALAFGLFDETTSANTISDHDFTNVDNNPEYELNDTGYKVTPEAKIQHDATGAINYAGKIRIRATRTVTINLRRPMWRKVGLAA